MVSAGRLYSSGGIYWNSILWKGVRPATPGRFQQHGFQVAEQFKRRPASCLPLLLDRHDGGAEILEAASGDSGRNEWSGGCVLGSGGKLRSECRSGDGGTGAGGNQLQCRSALSSFDSDELSRPENRSDRGERGSRRRTNGPTDREQRGGGGPNPLYQRWYGTQRQHQRAVS